MKNSIISFASAALLCLGGCHEPDELTPSDTGLGLNSISAQFSSGAHNNYSLAKATANPIQSAIWQAEHCPPFQ